MLNLYKNLFLLTLMASTLISISANSWLGVWIGLEMNLLSMIPLMNMSKAPQSTEASMKYFIVQAMASMLLLMGFLMDSIKSNLPMNLFTFNLSILWISTALMTKAGAAPFHFWFPEVVEGMNWINAIILLTWQKIAPLIILMYLTLNENLIMLVIITSVITGGLVGINQTSMRKMLSYSSINHLGWMLAALMFKETIWMWYFSIYSLMNILIIWMLKTFNISSISQLITSMKLNPQLKLFFILNLFSLGGIPPFIGFLPKWLTVNVIIMNKLYFLATVMIVTTLVTFYFYMRLAMPVISFSAWNSNLLQTMENFKNKKLMMLNLMMLMSLAISSTSFSWI